MTPEIASVEIEEDILAVQKVEAVPKILDVICRVTGMGFAAVARVTDKRWVCCAVKDEIAFGLTLGGELELESTICHEIRQSREAVAIDCVADDELYVGHHTPGRYGFQSYVSVPIVLSDGTFFGTLCAIDPRPAILKNRHAIQMFSLFAELIATQLDAIKKVAASSASLIDERQASELREQFVAVLGHDLRNPLASLAAGVRMLSKAESATSSSDILSLMGKSIRRMSQLIDDVLDLARSRLGGGLAVNIQPTNIKPMLDLVVAELELAHPETDFDVRLDLQTSVACDAERIGQMFSNLLANAVSHGAAGRLIRVEAKADGASFVLTVANHGAPISQSTVEKLFLPFYRGEEAHSGGGLGLGLYICSEIAKAHGGRLQVTSDEMETRFTFAMPS